MAEDATHVIDFVFMTDGVLMAIVCSLGIVGNVFALFILSRPEMKLPINIYLMLLAIYDALFLVSKILLYIPGQFSEQSDAMLKFYTSIEPFTELIEFALCVVESGSIWTTVGVSIERYIVVCYPLQAKKLCTYNRTILFNICIAVFAIGINFQAYLDLRWFWFEILTRGVIPFMLLICLNVSIYKTIKKARNVREQMTQKQQADTKVTMILLCVVAVFITCYTPQLLYNVIVMSTDIDFQFGSNFRGILHLTEAVNSAVNFIIYCAAGENFRKVVCNTFCKTREITTAEESASTGETKISVTVEITKL